MYCWRWFQGCLWVGLAAWAMLSGASLAAAQGQPTRKVPDPEEVRLETKDGVTLLATYYASNLGKEAVPVLMIHDYEGSRADYHELALYLQSKDGGYCAVLVPDLRGHGSSVKVKGETNDLDAKTLKPAHYARMITEDLEACKRFLKQKNNAEQLNINRLTVVGAGMGGVLAINWSVADWAWPPAGGVKQGQDVKALVLLSPNWSFKSLNITAAVGRTPITKDASVYILVGKGDTRDAKRLHDTIKRSRSDSKEDDLIMLTVETNLQGTKLLGLKNLGLPAYIAKFIDARVARQDFPWSLRKSPLAGD
jgi:pimeloyl-ACP methyl ester carboxylesterase